MNKVNVALIQSKWNADPKEAFEQVYETAKKVLSGNDIQILCLPEFFTGAPFYMPTRGHLKGIIDETIPGSMTDKFGELAKEFGTYIMCGTIIEREVDKYYNTCAVIDDNGEIIAKARKIHRYSSELGHLEAGDEQVLLDTKYGKIGICICSDFWIPEMPRILALRGAEIIYVPGGSLRQNIVNTKPVITANSANNVCYTLYCSIVGGVEGVRAGRNVSIQFEGHTSIASPRGMVNSLDNEEGVVIGELDMDEMRKLREVDTSFKETLFWSLWGREPERYKRLLEPYVGAQGSLEDMVVKYLNS